MNTELERQQQLLAALWRRGAAPASLRGVAAGLPRGMQAYRSNAGALAERALGAAFPTVRALVGDESFAALARALWHHAPPERGDVAQWGARLAPFVADDGQLADVPYLADVAELEWALHCAASGADCEPDAQSLALLAEHDPELLAIDLAAGTAIVESVWPIVTLWHAHRDGGDLATARVALAERRSECALVWRDGWRAACRSVDRATAAWTRALLAGSDIDIAIAAAGPAFDLSTWLAEALRERRITRVRRIQP